MTLHVLGAGFGRTGTNSLKLALEQLGFGPCHHMFEVGENPEQVPYWQAAARGDLPDWDTVFAGYKAAVDWPSAAFWRELAAYYPDAKVVLTVRPAEAWFRSVQNTILPAMQSYRDEPPGPTRDRRAMSYGLIVRDTFSGRMDDFDHATAVYNAHIAEVQRTIPAPRLLTYDVAEGWAPLCAHLGVPVPAEPFPHANTTQAFQARVSGAPKG